VRVRITYCAECGYEPQTLDLARALMVEFGPRIAAIELIPWPEGTLDVSIGGELVHSMSRDGGFPDTERVKQAVRDRLRA
jgi:selenoprotein W-related protein